MMIPSTQATLRPAYVALIFLAPSAFGFSTTTQIALPEIPSVLDIPPPADLPPSVASDLESRGIAVVPNYACPDTINLLRFDALRLQHGGHTISARTRQDAEKKMQNERGNGERNDNQSGSTKAPRSVRQCKHIWLIDSEGEATEKRNDRDAQRAGRALDRDVRRDRPRFLGPPYVGELCSTLEDAMDGISPFSDDAEYLARFPPDESESDRNHPVHLHETEAAYLYYDKGGYYEWHFDTRSYEGQIRPTDSAAMDDKDTNKKPFLHRRAFSFLLYLGGDESRRDDEWIENDGGALRTYPRISSADQRRRVHGVRDNGAEQNLFSMSDSSSGMSKPRLVGDPDGRSGTASEYKDIFPQEGMLVIFKSEAICHEVLPTKRERMALVGWIHGDLA